MDNEQLPSIMPEYMLSHAIAVLTHHPSYKDNADRQFLVEKMRPALLFILEPLLAQKDSFSYAFYKALIEKMKRHVVVSETPSDVLNKVGPVLRALFCPNSCCYLWETPCRAFGIDISQLKFCSKFA